MSSDTLIYVILVSVLLVIAIWRYTRFEDWHDFDDRDELR